MMMNYVGRLISDARMRRGWSFGDLARACGAKSERQVARLSQRLVNLEREGTHGTDLMVRAVKALHLDLAKINECLRMQRDEEIEDCIRWLNEPVPIELHVRPFSGFWYKSPLPEEVRNSRKAAIKHARAITRSAGVVAVLAVSRRISLTFANGRVIARRKASQDDHITPYMTVGGHRLRFVSNSRDQEKDGDER